MSSETVGESRISHFSGAYQAAGYVEDTAPPAGLRAVGGGVATEIAPVSLPAEVVTAVEVNEEPGRAVGAHAAPITDAEFQA